MIQTQFQEDIQKGSGFIIVSGILLLLMRMVVMGSPLVAGVSLAMMIGIMLIISGIALNSGPRSKAGAWLQSEGNINAARNNDLEPVSTLRSLGHRHSHWSTVVFQWFDTCYVRACG